MLCVPSLCSIFFVFFRFFVICARDFYFRLFCFHHFSTFFLHSFFHFCLFVFVNDFSSFLFIVIFIFVFFRHFFMFGFSFFCEFSLAFSFVVIIVIFFHSFFCVLCFHDFCLCCFCVFWCVFVFFVMFFMPTAIQIAIAILIAIAMPNVPKMKNGYNKKKYHFWSGKTFIFSIFNFQIWCSCDTRFENWKKMKIWKFDQTKSDFLRTLQVQSRWHLRSKLQLLIWIVIAKNKKTCQFWSGETSRISIFGWKFLKKKKLACSTETKTECKAKDTNKNFISAYVLCCVCVQVFFAEPAHFA